jgi:hypothetical protein
MCFTAENEFQLLYSLVISVLLTMFVAFSVFNRNDDRDLGPAWKLTKFPVLALKLCFQVIYLALAFPVKRSFGYYLYKIASASIHLQGKHDGTACVWLLCQQRA